MNFLDSLERHPIAYHNHQILIEKNLDEIPEGSSQDDNFLFFRNRENIKVYDRICDHNGGRLSLRGENASCPLHGWTFDLNAGSYTNARCSKKPIIDINEYELDSPLVSIPKISQDMETESFRSENDVEVRFLNHACLLFMLGGISFATDPWLVGSAFCNGWWLAKTSPKDAFVEINKCDFIYISHNHPDHLHKESLEKIRKDMPILTAGFESNSTRILLEDYGFTNIVTMDFSSALKDLKRELSLSVLKSGDFRDDSGLFVQYGRFKALLTVDSNFLNFHRFPKVDLLCSSFAGGASGFPLCFENYTEQEKKTVNVRNRGAIKATNILNIKATRAKYYMPYAGFFTELAERDSYIKDRNIKNSVEDFKQVCVSSGVDLLDVNEKQTFLFKGSRLIRDEVDHTERMLSPNTVDYLLYDDHLVDEQLSECVLKYFNGCEFNDDLVVELIPTDDDFSTFKQHFKLDFKKNSYEACDVSCNSKQIENRALQENLRYLQIKVRKAELLDVILQGKPWEDLSIGFQCRVYRNPNIYNSEFWFYFTNVYIGRSVAEV